MSIHPDTPIEGVKGVGPKYRDIFHKYGVRTVMDLLLHFPVAYIDFHHPSESLILNEKKLFKVVLIRFGLSRIFRKRLNVLTAEVRLGERAVQLVFFNKPYVREILNAGGEYYVYGMFQERNGRIQANTPQIFPAGDTGGEPVSPLYNMIGNIRSGMLKKLIGACLARLREPPEILPSVIAERRCFPPVVAALRGIHFPMFLEPERIETLKQRFIHREFYLFQLELQTARAFFQRKERETAYRIPPDAEQLMTDRAPFPLTEDQRLCCRSILERLRGNNAMSLLLQGDVGSGKTIVAFLALWLAAQSGRQGAFLAPTEILARQHFNRAREFFHDYPVALLTGATPARERKSLLRQLAEGRIAVLFGTHALLNEQVTFHDLSLAVIDEQHRFGVAQRAALYYKGGAVDMLIATATPIPRTLLLSLYNDVDVALIKTKPAGRQPIVTKIYEAAARDAFYRWLQAEIIRQRHKTYIILPLVEESEHFPELRSIEAEHDYFKQLFGEIGFGAVSGRMKPEEKDAMITKFTAGEIQVLVATTVVEVGIDVPDAAVIVIENADRYGLSQLHQLRGRVGRGDQPSSCFLIGSPNITDSGKMRLKTIASTEDGFQIAETDLKMRGGGILTGLEQAGFLDFKTGDLRDHWNIFLDARADAAETVKNHADATPFINTFIETVRKKLQHIHFN